MVYVLVLFGSFLVICAILFGRVLLRNRSVRKYVRSIKQRTQSAEDRGAELIKETPVAKPKKNMRTTAIQLQESRAFLHRAEKAIARGEIDIAEGLLIQALTVNSGAHDVRAELAKLYLTAGRDQKAEAMYKELLQFKDDASLFGNLGLAYYRQGKFDDAREAYQAALNRDENNPERLASLGRACIATQRFADATILLEKATQRLSRDTKLLLLLAECFLQIKDHARAKETYQRINKLEPYNEDVKNKLGMLEECSS
ncbi:tetratricopeptide repeat protein [Patescibacteria group bacterium]|nr:tetratricopeptide repeat protein [Patescibacteria group bacterium]MBU2260188.1 tetratricopeptide repeat protein [Patescibacteria group bacterium]